VIAAPQSRALQTGAIAFALLAWTVCAHAHGIAGNRYFVGTVTFDDPAVADENPAVETLNWGFSIQYSTYYLTSRFNGGPPKDEPLNQLVPLVEFNFDSPLGQATAATVNPGFAYVAVTWQVAAEIVVPMNRQGGSGAGFRAQLLFFLDDLVPPLFGKPLLSDQPNRSQIAWH
jgi:hypothetical protein